MPHTCSTCGDAGHIVMRGVTYKCSCKTYAALPPPPPHIQGVIAHWKGPPPPVLAHGKVLPSYVWVDPAQEYRDILDNIVKLLGPEEGTDIPDAMRGAAAYAKLTETVRKLLRTQEVLREQIPEQFDGDSLLGTFAAILDCPHNEPGHYWKDGCPACHSLTGLMGLEEPVPAVPVAGPVFEGKSTYMFTAPKYVGTLPLPTTVQVGKSLPPTRKEPKPSIVAWDAHRHCICADHAMTNYPGCPVHGTGT